MTKFSYTKYVPPKKVQRPHGGNGNTLMIRVHPKEKHALKSVCELMGVPMNLFVRAALGQVIGQLLDTGLPELRGWMLRDIIELDLPDPPDCKCYGKDPDPSLRPEVGLGCDCPKCGRHWPWNQEPMEIPPYVDPKQPASAAPAIDPQERDSEGVADRTADGGQASGGDGHRGAKPGLSEPA